MYLSIKTIRIIFAVVFAIIALVNLTLSNDPKVPDYVNQKIGNISFFLVILMGIAYIVIIT